MRRSLFVTVVATSVVLASAASSISPGMAAGLGPARGELFGQGVAAGAVSRHLPDSIAAGFSDVIVYRSLTYATALAFSSDGRAFVAEKSGVIKVFHGLNDDTPTVFADLSTQVMDYSDRGLLGLALDPTFPANPYVYVLYSLDAPIGGTPPVFNDWCDDPLGAGCVIGARLSRLQASGDVMVGPEQVLIEGWCQQFPSHSIGTVAFGADGALYVGGGDGASFEFADYGQNGNPCGDPGGPNPTPPTAQGGALRSQDLRTSGDPTGFDGSILRVDPATGDALPDNPLYGGSVSDDDRVVTFGYRNPYRFTLRPDTNQLWVGDVGWNGYEEIDRVPDPIDPVVENGGWPCYEGVDRQPDYDGLDLSLCESLYGGGTALAPYYQYSHWESVVHGDGCPLGYGSVISAMAFYRQGTYPPAFQGGLFFGDHSRQCIWVMLKGANGEPDPAKLYLFRGNARFPVDLKTGPAGDLYYVNFDAGQVRRIRYRP